MYLFKNLQNCLTLDKGACTGTKSNRDDQRIQYNKRHVSIHILIDRAGNLVCLSKISWKNMFIHIWSSSFDQDSMESFKRLENFSYTDVRKGGEHSYTYNKKVDTLKTFKIKYSKNMCKICFFLNLYSCINKREF